jgi:two-component system cell cycle response regulator
MPARILIIEGEGHGRALMVSLLRAAGHVALDAPDAAAGLRLAREAAPDLVLCDAELAGSLKADPGWPPVPLLALIAMEDGREPPPEAGFDGWLARPIEPDSFVAELEAFLPAPLAKPDQAAGTLLLVDDDPFMLGLLQDTLEGEGYRILSARSGEEALELLARHAVQVILSDQCMPGLQGTELLERASRLQPEAARLILSGESDLEAIERACAAGLVDRYLAKPWAGAELKERVRAAFRLRRA